MDSAPISSLLTFSEWEELERIIEAVASRPNLDADLSISESDYEDYPDSETSTVDLNLLDDTTLDELYVNLDTHSALTRDPMDQVHWGNTVRVSNYIRDLQQPGGVGGRVWTPFGKTIQPEPTQLDVVVEILQCIIKILCIVVFACLCFFISNKPWNKWYGGVEKQILSFLVFTLWLNFVLLLLKKSFFSPHLMFFLNNCFFVLFKRILSCSWRFFSFPHLPYQHFPINCSPFCYHHSLLTCSSVVMANHESDDEWWGTTDDEKSKQDHFAYDCVTSTTQSTINNEDIDWEAASSTAAFTRPLTSTPTGLGRGVLQRPETPGRIPSRGRGLLFTWDTPSPTPEYSTTSIPGRERWKAPTTTTAGRTWQVGGRLPPRLNWISATESSGNTRPTSGPPDFRNGRGRGTGPPSGTLWSWSSCESGTTESWEPFVAGSRTAKHSPIEQENKFFFYIFLCSFLLCPIMFVHRQFPSFPYLVAFLLYCLLILQKKNFG